MPDKTWKADEKRAEEHILAPKSPSEQDEPDSTQNSGTAMDVRSRRLAAPVCIARVRREPQDLRSNCQRLVFLGAGAIAVPVGHADHAGFGQRVCFEDF